MDRPLNQPLLRELEAELPVTRELLRRLPEASWTWSPHPRAMSLGRLGSHIAEVTRYGSLVLTTQRVDSEVRARGPMEPRGTTALLEVFDREAAEFTAALGAADDALLRGRWSYCKGDRVVFEVSRIGALRRFVLNHLVHHRGQLSTYLRQLDVELPQIYGPSADDSTGY
jgi:uncharacterized damage-inducible protein DinB